jgi:sugar phosphate isomerase/epimerase
MGCHVKIPKVQEMKQLPGYGPLDFGPILKALKDTHYSGRTSVFMHPVPRGIPILPTASEVTRALNRSREYLDEVLSKQE